jgi:Protein of unknown function (DUF2735)
MTTTISGSAKIYAFPPRGHFAVGGRHQAAEQPAKAVPGGITIASSSGWYHDEAIQEAVSAEQRRKS